jgi:GMP synthase-like glutamine amidotransferase
MYEQQAFRWGEIVYGFQFHLEFTESIITRPRAGARLAALHDEAGADVKKIIAETPRACAGAHRDGAAPVRELLPAVQSLAQG